MRQLANVAYALLVEHRDQKEIDQLDRELVVVPGRDASTGVEGLMAMFGSARQ